MSKPRRDLPAGRQVKISQIPDSILRQLLTPYEIRMLKNRFQIMNLLQDGLSIRKVATVVKVGTDTVVRVSRMVERRPRKKHIRTSTPWIFGKSDG